MVCLAGRTISGGDITEDNMTTRTEDWQYAFKMGYDAYLNDERQVDNPFSQDDESWEAWKEGYQQAAEDN